MSRSFDLLTEACRALPTQPRKMFGGHGFFAPNGGMFAGVLSDDQLILKLSDPPTRAALIEAGGQPWTYHGRDKAVTMSDWIVIPDSFYDDEEELQSWVKRAHRLAPAKVKKKAAVKAKKAPVKAKKPPAKKKTKKK